MGLVRLLRRLAVRSCAVALAITVVGMSGLAMEVVGRAPHESPTAVGAAPAAIVDYLAARSGAAAIAVYDAGDGSTWASSDTSFVSASVVKLAIIEGLLFVAQQQHRDLTTQEQARAVAMISSSDNDAASALWRYLGSAPGMKAILVALGATNTVPAPKGEWGLTTTTASDQVTLVRLVAYRNPILDDASRSVAADLLAGVVPAQRWGVSAGVATDASVRLKNGWLPTATGWVVNSVGYVTGGGTDYVVAVLTRDNPTEDYGIRTVEGLSTMLGRLTS
jgi:hypothetical protein